MARKSCITKHYSLHYCINMGHYYKRGKKRGEGEKEMFPVAKII